MGYREPISLAHLHDLLVVELPLLCQVRQLAHVLEEYSSQAVIAHSRTRWVLEGISKRGNDVRRVCRGAIGGHVNVGL
jgi:hypothetical protein